MSHPHAAWTWGAFGLTLVAMLCGADSPAGGGELWERYLKGYQGPYRGRVIDAETKQPLAGAAVVAIWHREKIQLIQLSTVFHDAREVLTDANGEFVLDAPDVEREAPAKTLRPYFVFFTPGYALARGTHEARGETIGLRRLRTQKERLAELPTPFDIGAVTMDETNRNFVWRVSRERIQNFLRLIEVERSALGLAPAPY